MVRCFWSVVLLFRVFVGCVFGGVVGSDDGGVGWFFFCWAFSSFCCVSASAFFRWLNFPRAARWFR